MDADFLVEYVHGRHTVRDYFDRFMSDWPFEGAFSGCPELRSRCSEHLWAAFSELDAIPRADALWARSNMRATFSKLRDFDRVLSFEESNLPRCWRSFTIALCAGDVDRFKVVAGVLLRTGELSTSDFICSSFNMQSVSGWETHETAADVLHRAGMANAARERLNAIVEGRYVGDTDWAKKVLRLLEGAG